MRAIELGGSLAGFQFTLSKCGVKVTNVDPGDEAAIGWPVSQEMIGRLNRFFHTDVELVSSRLEESGLEEASFDRVVSISTIEHIPREELPAILSEVKRLLKPGGMFVLTVDLFLDLYPFTNADSNRLGHNISISDIVLWSGLDLVQGNRQELYGFEEFDAKEILRKLPEYLYGSGYPSLAQALVLQKKV